MDIQKKKHYIGMAMVVVVDQSGSMQATVGGKTKIQLANESVVKVAELLKGSDRIAVNYTDTNPKWVVEMTEVGGRLNAIRNAVTAQKGGGGGIYVYSGLVPSYEALEDEPAGIRHVILFSDAADSEQQNGCEDLARRYLKQKNVTLSVVAMGRESDMDTPFLKRLAKAGDGRFYLVNDMRRLKRIFVQDTVIASKRAIREETFRPTLAGMGASFFRGVDFKAMPALDGYVVATMRPEGELLMLGLEDDPLLARWNYGLGRAVAFTSDARAQWAKSWLGWDGYHRMWPQLIRWVGRKRGNSGFRSSISFDGGKATLVVDAVSSSGEVEEFLNLKARVSREEDNGISESVEVPLIQKGPGRYQAEFPAMESGIYFATVTDGENKPVSQIGGALGYPAEFANFEPRAWLLEDLAQMTGGQQIQKPVGVFKHSDEKIRTYRDIWRELLVFAIICLFFEVLARRMFIPEAWDKWYADRQKTLAEARAKKVSSDPTVSALKKRKREVREEREFRLAPEKPVPGATAKPEEDPTEDEESDDGGSYLSQLKKAKMRARDPRTRGEDE